MADAPELTDDCWTHPRGLTEPGDVYLAVPLPALSADSELFEHPDVDRLVLVPAQVAFAMVVQRYEHYIVLVPVAVAEAIPDRDLFELIVDAGRSAREWIRL